MKQYNRLVLVGDGWGAVAAYKGLQFIGIPICVMTNDVVLQNMSKPFKGRLDSLCDELIIFAGYKTIIRRSILSKNVCVNIHYSLLPKYRGFHSTVWAILNNEPLLGVTVHLMDEYIDNGPILHQYVVKNDFIRTSTDYMNLFNSYIESNIGKIINDFILKKIKPMEQDKSGASWVGKRNEQDCKIDFTKPISYQKAFFRALVEPYPLPYVICKGKKLIIKNPIFHKSPVETHIGRILNIDDDGVWVKIQDGYMVISSMYDEKGCIYSIDNFKIGQYLQ